MVLNRLRDAGGRAVKRLIEAREEQARRLIALHRPRDGDRF